MVQIQWVHSVVQSPPPNSRNFHHPLKKPCTIKLSFSISPPILPWKSLILSWRFFTYHVFKVHPCCSIYQYFIFVYSWTIFHYVAITFYPSIHQICGHVGCLYFGVIMINTMNIHSCISLGGYVFSFLLDVIVESKSNSF